jgi:hypothetical protein
MKTKIKKNEKVDFGKDNTHLVCYKYRVAKETKSDIIKNLDQYYATANKGYDLFIDFFLNLFGGINKNNLSNAKYKFSGENVSYTFPDEVILFYHWFSRETFSNQDNIVIPTELLNRLETYYLEQNIVVPDNIWNIIHATVNVQEDNKVWVDRRAGFKSLNINNSFITWLTNSKDFPLQEKNVTDSITYCRDLFSIIFGDGNKSDFKAYGEKIESLRQFIALPEDQIINKCREHLGINSEIKEAKDINKNIFGGKSGTPSKIAKLLANTQPVDEASKKLKDAINSAIDRSNHRIQQPKEDFTKIIKNFADVIGHDYKADYYCEFGSKALERIKSNRRNALNTFYRRTTLDCAKPTINPLLEDMIQKYKQKKDSKDQECLTFGDINGLKDVQEWGSAIEAEKNSRNRRANYALLKNLESLNCENWIEEVENYQKYDENLCDFRRLRTPTLCRFTIKSDHPQFGVSRPAVSFNLQSQTWTLNLLGAKASFVCKNKRANNDLHNNGEHTAPRNTKLIAQSFGVPLNTIKSEHNRQGVKLVKTKKGFYLYVTYQLRCKPYIATKELANLTDGHRFLSVDPGIRESMMFSVGEIVRVPSTENRLYYKDDKGLHRVRIDEGKYVRILEVGSIREEDFHRSNSNIFIDRFNTLNSRITNEQEQKFWNFLLDLEIVNEECPEKYLSFLSNVTRSLKWYWKTNPNPDFKTIADLTNIMKNNSRNTGDCSYKRIISLKDLRSIYQSCIHLLEKPDKRKVFGADKVTTWLTESLQYVTDKIYNLREERTRRIVNLLAQKAVKYHAKMVFLEKTNLDVHASMSKQMSKRIDIWTPKRILELADKQLKPLGINLFLMNSRLSSHTDFADHNISQPRYEDLPESVILSEIKYYKKLKKSSSSRKNLYKNAIIAELSKMGTNLEECRLVFPQNARVLRFPYDRGGKWFPSSAGWINADENAAMYFLISGLRFLWKIRASGQAAKKQ